MMHRIIIQVCFLCLSNIFVANCQISDAGSLITASRSYYKSLNLFSVSVNVKSKTSISQDTLFSHYRCFINNNDRNRLFLGSKTGMLINDSKEYLLFLTTKEYEEVKTRGKKFNAYHQRYINYPFVEADKFFHDFDLQHFSFKETDTAYLLISSVLSYEFRKSNNSIKTIKKIKYDELTKGISYENTTFGECLESDTETAVEINNALRIVSSKENQIEENGKINAKKPEQFDITLLKNKSLKIKNNSTEGFDDKIIFFDFFYKDCYPCVKSYPKVEKFFENRGSELIVIGVDHKLGDTTNIEMYLNKYNIRYPVIIGEVALEMVKNLDVGVWPTFIIVDSGGKILEYKEGYSEAFFKKIGKKYLNR